MQIPTPYYDDWDDLYALIRDLVLGGVLVTLVLALYRIGGGLMLGARVKALDEFEDAYAPDEREVLIRKIKRASMH